MADIAEAIRDQILSYAVVTDDIGQRMYHQVRRQNATLPCATIDRESEEHIHTISNRSGFVRTRLQVKTFATTYTESDSIARNIYKSGIAAVTGSMQGMTVCGISVEDGVRQYLVRDSRGGDDHTYVSEFDLMVTYTE